MTADFLTSITNPVERLEAEGFEDRVPRSAEEFAAAWRRNARASVLLHEIAEFNASAEQQRSWTVEALWYVLRQRRRIKGELIIL